MKVLIRKWDNKYYVWKTATWKNGEYYVDGCRLEQFNILSIKEDDRCKYVRCSYCGTYIKDDPKSIEEHFVESESKKDCFKCRNLRTYGVTNPTKSYEKNANGTYRQTVVSDVNLHCGNVYPSQDINAVNLSRYCAFYHCRRSGVKKVSDILIEYPDPFNKQITVDLLKAKGFEYERYHNGYFEYDLKMRNTLKACVNELGIVDHFIVKHRGYSFLAYYSEKYDELFYVESGKYIMRDEDYVSESKHSASKGKISSLYKEASK